MEVISGGKNYHLRILILSTAVLKMQYPAHRQTKQAYEEIRQQE